MSEDFIREEARKAFRDHYGVSGDQRFAGFWIRVGAEGIDAIVLSLITIVPTMVLAFQVPETTIQIVGFFVSMVYYTIFQASGWQATPGKRLLGLHLMTADGERVGVARSFARFWGLILSGVLLCIGYLMVAFTQEKTGLHDLLCNTRVVHGRT
jgi:uncharacterized RDD family membrane protein YckC